MKDEKCRKCGHSLDAHLHYRSSRECVADLCLCPGFRPIRWWHKPVPTKGAVAGRGKSPLGPPPPRPRPSEEMRRAIERGGMA